MAYEIPADNFRDKRRREQQSGTAFEFPAGKPPLGSVTTPRRIPQPGVPSAGQAIGANARAAGQAIDQATSGLTLDNRPKQTVPSIAAAVQQQQQAQPVRVSAPVVIPAGQGLGLLPSDKRKAQPTSIDALPAPAAGLPARTATNIYDGTGGVLDPSRAQKINEFLQGGEQQRAQGRARQQQAFARSTAAEGQISRRNALENAARSARIDANSFKQVAGSRGQRDLMDKAYGLKAAAADAALPPQVDPFDETSIPKDFAQIEGTKAQTELSRQQGITAGIGNQAAQQQSDLLLQLGGAAPNDPNRRALIDRALAGQGKDPDAGRFLSIDVLGPQDQFGQATQLRGALDTRTGAVLGGGTTPTAAQEIPAGAVEKLRSNPKLAKDFDAKYGEGSAAKYLS